MFCERINVFGGNIRDALLLLSSLRSAFEAFFDWQHLTGFTSVSVMEPETKSVFQHAIYTAENIYIIWQIQYSPKKITGCPTAFSSIASQHAFVAVLTHNPLHSGRSITTVGLVDRTQTNNGSLAAVWHILSSDFRVCPVEWINVLLRSIASRTSTFLSLTASNLNTVHLLRTTWTPQQTAVSVREEVCTACKAWKDFIRCESAEWKWKWRLRSCCYSIFNNTNIK